MSLAAAPAAARACLSVVEGHRKVYFNDLQLAAQAVSLLFGQGPVLGMSKDEDSMVSCISKRILEAAAVHFQCDFKNLRDVILFLRRKVRAPTDLVKSLERINSAHGFVKHMTAFSCDGLLAQMLLLPPFPCAPEAGPPGQGREDDWPEPMDPRVARGEAPVGSLARAGAPPFEDTPGLYPCVFGSEPLMDDQPMDLREHRQQDSPGFVDRMPFPGTLDLAPVPMETPVVAAHSTMEAGIFPLADLAASDPGDGFPHVLQHVRPLASDAGVLDPGALHFCGFRRIRPGIPIHIRPPIPIRFRPPVPI